MWEKTILPRSPVGLPGINFRNPEWMWDLRSFSSWFISNHRDIESGKESQASQKVRFLLVLYQHQKSLIYKLLIQDCALDHLSIIRKPQCFPCCIILFTYQSHNICQVRSALMSSAQWPPSPFNTCQFHPHRVPGLPSYRMGCYKYMLTVSQAVHRSLWSWAKFTGQAPSVKTKHWSRNPALFLPHPSSFVQQDMSENDASIIQQCVSPEQHLISALSRKCSSAAGCGISQSILNWSKFHTNAYEHREFRALITSRR